MVAFLTVLAGCPWIDAQTAANRRDLDGDGANGDIDCDDLDPAVFVGAPESCNGIDDDCDGEIDEEPSDAHTFYADNDGDGYGDPASTVAACEAPAGYVTDATDCDDGADFIHPGAEEDCGGDDLDCDGDPSVGATIGLTVYYVDVDGDGYGSEAQELCELERGYSAQDGDCDDQDPNVFPGATEICGDHVDNDCDGGPNDCGLGDATLSEAIAYRLDGAASSHFGAGLAGGFDLDTDADGYDDLVVGAPEQDGGAGTVTVFLSNGSASSFWPVTLDIWTDSPTPEFGTGLAVGQYGEEDEVGVLVGAPGEDGGNGAAWLCRAVDEGEFDCAVALAGSSESRAGAQAAIWGDADGSGLGSWAVAAYDADDGGASAGAIYLFHGAAPSGDLWTLADAVLVGAAGGDNAGTSLSARAADFDGDGLGDWAVGAPRAGDGAGAAYLLSLQAPSGSLADADAVLTGTGTGADGEQAGRSVAVLGDTDGDGYADLLVGAPYNDAQGDNAGAAYLVHGPVSSGNLAAAHATLLGDAGDYAGWVVSALGDIDGDGRADAGIGTLAGRAYVLRSDVSGTLSLVADATLTGDESGDRAGSALAPAGDRDGDGYDEFLLGAPLRDGRGAAWLVYGTGM